LKALRWHGRGDVRLDDVKAPQLITSDDVIIEVEATGICGTDQEEARHGPVSIPTSSPHPLTGFRAPITLGHEIVGRVIAAGPEAGVAVGTRVTPTPVIWCGKCNQCLAGAISRCEVLAVTGLSADGGMTDFVRVHAYQCLPVPEGIAAATAALVEPYAVAVHALDGVDVSGLLVSVVGFGSVGSCIADVVLSRGADAVIAIDPDPWSRQRAIDGGAAAALEPDQARSMRASLVIEASGAERGLATALLAAESGGAIVVVGLRGGEVPIPLPTLVFGELTIRARVGHDVEAMKQSVAGIASGSFGTRFHEIDVVDLETARSYILDQTSDRRGKKIVFSPRAEPTFRKPRR